MPAAPSFKHKKGSARAKLRVNPPVEADKQSRRNNACSLAKGSGGHHSEHSHNRNQNKTVKNKHASWVDADTMQDGACPAQRRCLHTSHCHRNKSYTGAKMRMAQKKQAEQKKKAKPRYTICSHRLAISCPDGHDHYHRTRDKLTADEVKEYERLLINAAVYDTDEEPEDGQSDTGEDPDFEAFYGDNQFDPLCGLDEKEAREVKEIMSSRGFLNHLPPQVGPNTPARCSESCALMDQCHHVNLEVREQKGRNGIEEKVPTVQKNSNIVKLPPLPHRRSAAPVEAKPHTAVKVGAQKRERFREEPRFDLTIDIQSSDSESEGDDDENAPLLDDHRRNGGDNIELPLNQGADQLVEVDITNPLELLRKVVIYQQGVEGSQYCLVRAANAVKACFGSVLPCFTEDVITVTNNRDMLNESEYTGQLSARSWRLFWRQSDEASFQQRHYTQRALLAEYYSSYRVAQVFAPVVDAYSVSRDFIKCTGVDGKGDYLPSMTARMATHLASLPLVERIAAHYARTPELGAGRYSEIFQSTLEHLINQALLIGVRRRNAAGRITKQPNFRPGGRQILSQPGAPFLGWDR